MKIGALKLVIVMIVAVSLGASSGFAQSPTIASRLPGKVHLLPATLDNTQWGFYDNAQKPVLRIDSGDTVVMETMNHAHDSWVPGRTMADIMKAARDNPQRGPHSITGPIFVNGAEPGDTLKVRINKIVPRAFGYNINLPGIAGQFPKEFTQGRIRYLYIDLDKRVIEYLPGIYVPLRPFPGLIGVARKAPGPYTTRPPGEYGGNMDIRDLTEGATIHFPVWVAGGLLWSGDSHAAQGNGEVNVSAVETAFREMNLTFEVVKGGKLDYPRAENASSWISMGFDPDLDKALDRALDETAKLLAETRTVPIDRARALVLSIADCRVSQVVNGTKGVHCFTPKQSGAKEDLARPTTTTAQHYVTYATNASVSQAMDVASLAMIDSIAKIKDISRVESYGLASVAMDCRVGAVTSTARAVHCLVPKRLWDLPR
jgi:acetamidase/formamidase